MQKGNEKFEGFWKFSDFVVTDFQIFQNSGDIFKFPK